MTLTADGAAAAEHSFASLPNEKESCGSKSDSSSSGTQGRLLVGGCRAAAACAAKEVVAVAALCSSEEIARDEGIVAEVVDIEIEQGCAGGMLWSVFAVKAPCVPCLWLEATCGWAWGSPAAGMLSMSNCMAGACLLWRCRTAGVA